MKTASRVNDDDAPCLERREKGVDLLYTSTPTPSFDLGLVICRDWGAYCFLNNLRYTPLQRFVEIRGQPVPSEFNSALRVNPELSARVFLSLRAVLPFPTFWGVPATSDDQPMWRPPYAMGPPTC